MSLHSQLGRRIGVMLDRDIIPEELASFARKIDGSGADDVWIVEDLGWSGAISAAAVVLAATHRVRVGIGILPAAYRNPVLLAMELATLARLHPGRLIVGIGHGVREWLEQAGAVVPSPLALLEETVVAVRSLLAGETVSLKGRAVSIDGVRLTHPPAVAPPLVTGVIRPRSLELSGRVADGTIIIEGRRPQDLEDAKAHIGRGQAAACGTRPHELIAITHLYVDGDPTRVHEVTAPYAQEFAEFLEVDPGDVLMATGSADAAAEVITSLWEGGAETVVLHPVGDDKWQAVRRVLSALGR
ncbi:LLM class flavin-dependent oxidoreductase [Streptomyces sp. C10]|uniref:LLM class flavin-dependent oxidoreductase n=1 Tax=Streptomyces sp. C10 TaxID=531941 RepID=UPI003980EB7F